jgi:hypothetical protein
MSDQIIVTDRLAHQLHDETWARLMESDSELLASLMPRAIQNGVLARVEWPTTSAMSLALSRSSNFVKISRKGEESDCPPPGALVRSILERWKAENQDAAVMAVRRLYGAD